MYFTDYSISIDFYIIANKAVNVMYFTDNSISIDFYIIADKAVKLTQPRLKTNLSWRGDVELICTIWHDT